MVLLVTTFALVVLFATLMALFLRRLHPSDVVRVDVSAVNTFSLDKYRPMLRLLSEADLEFLAKQPGCSKKMLRELRVERRKIFRAYLANLIADFNMLQLAARLALVHSNRDRPELAAALFRQRLMFVWAVLKVETQLLLHSAGLPPIRLGALLGAVENMRLHANALQMNSSL